MPSISESEFIHLYKGSLIPAYVILVSLTWVLYDYLLTLPEEVQLVWPQRWNRSKIAFLFVRYYTIALLVLNTTEIHLFAHKGHATNSNCIAFDIVLRVCGAIALWAIEIIMQLRVWALFGCSRKIAIFNGVLFLGSIISFLGITIYDGLRRGRLIASAIHLPLPGCPAINGGIQWAEWVPAAIFEGILFSFVLYRYIFKPPIAGTTGAMSMYSTLIKSNMLYFSGVGFILIFDNLMTVGKTHIPWFSLGPFYASLGIMTSRVLLHFIRSQVVDNGIDLIDDLKSGTVVEGSQETVTGV